MLGDGKRSAIGFGFAALIAFQPLAAQSPLSRQADLAATGRALLDDGDLHVVLCGTSGPIFAPDRAGPCTAILAAGRFFVVDVGAGSVDSMLRLGLPLGEVTAVLLTHFHSDHMTEVGEINFTTWTRGAGTEPLRVVGPEGVDQVVAGFLQAYALDLGYRVQHHGAEVMPPAGARAVAETMRFDPPARAEQGAQSVIVHDEAGLVVSSFLVDHPPIVPSVGYRFDYGGRSVVVSGDTVASANLIAASRGVDLLVHEAMSDAVVSVVAPALERRGNVRGARILRDALDNHTFPPALYRLAAEAGVKTVVLSHLVPPLPPEQAAPAFTQGREVFAGDVVVGEDGMHFVLPPETEEIRQERLGDQARARD